MKLFIKLPTDYFFCLSRVESMSHSRREETKPFTCPIKICPTIFAFDESLEDFHATVISWVTIVIAHWAKHIIIWSSSR